MRGWIKCLALFVGLTLHVAAMAQSTFVSMVPVRLMDTHPGGATVDTQGSGGGPVSSKDLQVLGRAGIPASGVSAVALNVTVTEPGNFGYLVVYPTGTTPPLASNINYVAGLSISNEVIAKIGANGQVSFVNSGGSNIIVDVTGYFPSNSDLFPLPPARLMDTRSGMQTVDGVSAGEGAIGQGATRDLLVLGRGGVPSSGVTAVIVNVTATQPTGIPYITVWPSGTPQPNASNINLVAAGQTRANLVMVAPGSNGKISIYNSSGNTDVIVDIVGYFSSSATFGSLVPARLLDTRTNMPTVDGTYSGGGALGSAGTLNLAVLGRGGVPSSGVGAVALNIIAVNPAATGYLVAWGTGTTTGNAPPPTMGFNFAASSTIASLVIAQVGSNGKVSINNNSAGTTHVVADVVGWFPSTTYLANGSFETPTLAAGSFQNNPGGASWAFSGSAGISTPNSTYTASTPEVPLGNQVGFLQNTGCISESAYLTANPVLSLTATQRVNYNSQLQSIAVYVNNVLQPITIGSKYGAYIAYSITPPRDYYATYGVNLSSVTTGGTYTIKICGTNNVGDATALIDTVAISTPSNRAFGFWDSSGIAGAWRSDYQDASTAPDFASTCYFPTGSNAQFGVGFGPYCKQPVAWPNANWFSSNSNVAGPSQTPYVTGLPYWQVIANVEDYNKPSCTSGPPDQGIPLLPRGATSGARFDILDNTSFKYPSLGADKIYQLVYLPGYIADTYCYPYLAFSASSRHGNGRPIAIMDAAGNYRPRLAFKESVFQSSGIAWAYVVITIGGFDDNIQRSIFLEVGESPQASANDIANEYWNWPIKNSKYYPGWKAAIITASNAQTRCGFSSVDMPVLSFANQWIPSGQSPSAISSYNFDLYKLIQCVATETITQGTTPTVVSGWDGVSNQLPNPLVIEQIEWAVETQTDSSNPSPWIGFWGMQIQ